MGATSSPAPAPAHQSKAISSRIPRLGLGQRWHGHPTACVNYRPFPTRRRWPANATCLRGASRAHGRTERVYPTFSTCVGVSHRRALRGRNVTGHRAATIDCPPRIRLTSPLRCIGLFAACVGQSAGQMLPISPARHANMRLCHRYIGQAVVGGRREVHQGWRYVSSSLPPKEFDWRANQHARQAKLMEQSVNAGKLVGIGDVFTVLRQQVLYAGQGSGGYVECIDSRGSWHH